MVVKRYISFLSVFFASFLCHAQAPTHTLVGTAGGVYDGDTLFNGIDYIAWSIGEVVVFNDQVTNGDFPHPRTTLAQAMQSYIPYVPVINCPKVTVSSNNVNLCDGAGFTQVLTYKSSFDGSQQKLDSLQWYFNDGNGEVKIAGATDTSSKTYTPYFPGSYFVRLKYKGNTCEGRSTPIPVNMVANTLAPPQITTSGSPINVLTASAAPIPGKTATIQWYVYVDVGAESKFLLIAGGNNPSQKVRYNGIYMAMATYQGGCRLSSTFGLSNPNGQSILRATDVRIEGNTIYIPEEGAPEYASLSIYPNPASGSFSVHFNSPFEIAGNAALYGSTGTLLKEIVFSEGGTYSRTAYVNADDLGAGLYFVKMNQDSEQFVQKVVIYK